MNTVAGFSPARENPFRVAVCVLSLFILTNGEVITAATAQMHTVSQPKLTVLKEFNRDKCVTGSFIHSDVHISDFVNSCIHYRAVPQFAEMNTK